MLKCRAWGGCAAHPALRMALRATIPSAGLCFYEAFVECQSETQMIQLLIACCCSKWYHTIVLWTATFSSLLKMLTYQIFLSCIAKYRVAKFNFSDQRLPCWYSSQRPTWALLFLSHSLNHTNLIIVVVIKVAVFLLPRRDCHISWLTIFPFLSFLFSQEKWLFSCSHNLPTQSESFVVRKCWRSEELK